MKKIDPSILINLGLLLVALVSSVMIGSVFISPVDIIRGLLGLPVDGSVSTILWDIRIPRTILIALVGASLAGSGTAYQGIFRNPLADPYLIGIASGAGLGAVLAMTLRWPVSMLDHFMIPAFAFTGSIVSVSIVTVLARRDGGFPTANLILSGVAVSTFFGAITSFFMLNSSGELRRAISWLMGGVSLVNWNAILVLLPFLLVGFSMLLVHSYSLNILQFGDDQARQMGIDVDKARMAIIISTSLITASAVSFAGIIGFVGLIVPHIYRILWGADHRRLIPLSILGGAILLLFSDVLARTLLAPREIPVGIVTTLIGVPFFLWLLRTKKVY
jgi:iron complex transport system permease protein